MGKIVKQEVFCFGAFKIYLVPVEDVRDFIEVNHYSKSINGVKTRYVFAAYENNQLVACALYGSLSTTAWKKYSDSELKVVELRRIVSIVKTKNFLSQLVSRTIKYLKIHSDIELIVSYADPEHGHTGYIYQALNFEYGGITNKDTVLVAPCGKVYHSRSLRVKYKGKLKPFAEKLNLLNNEGLLIKQVVRGKHIYTYPLRRKKLKTIYPKGNELFN